MLKIYGSMLCPDCLKCREDLDAAGVAYDYLDFSESLLHLKEFLRLRDSHPALAPAREGGFIGIPCIVDGDEVKLEWGSYVSQANA